MVRLNMLLLLLLFFSVINHNLQDNVIPYCNPLNKFIAMSMNRKTEFYFKIGFYQFLIKGPRARLSNFDARIACGVSSACSVTIGAFSKLFVAERKAVSEEYMLLFMVVVVGPVISFSASFARRPASQVRKLLWIENNSRIHKL